MKAIIHRRYGGPETMELADRPIPEIDDEQVLVRVRAASVNAYDWHLLRGRPFLARFGEGFRRPKTEATGVDASGIVEAVGKAVTDLQPGDEVYGGRAGAFGEYVAGRSFVPKPANLSFEEAAAVPMAGQTALQALRDKAKVQPGQHVLVTGAGGGVGTFVVQIAKAYGATVTAMTRPSKADLLRSLGADHVIDRDEFATTDLKADVVIDAAGYRGLGEFRRVMAPGATFVLVGPAGGDWLGPILHVGAAVLRTKAGRGRFLPFLAQTRTEDLLALKDLIEAGKVRPLVDRVYPLEEAAEAVRYLEDGQVAGKVVVRVSEA